jgi:hypothetical protein
LNLNLVKLKLFRVVEQSDRKQMKTVKIWNIGWLALVSLACTRHPATENPQFKFQNPQVLVANLLANNPIQPRFAPGGREIIFSGRLDGDLWDGIYQVPTIGGLPQKIYGANGRSALSFLFPRESARWFSARDCHARYTSSTL